MRITEVGINDLTIIDRGDGRFRSTGVYTMDLQHERSKITELEHKKITTNKHSYKVGPVTKK